MQSSASVAPSKAQPTTCEPAGPAATPLEVPHKAAAPHTRSHSKTRGSQQQHAGQPASPLSKGGLQTFLGQVKPVQPCWVYLRAEWAFHNPVDQH